MTVYIVMKSFSDNSTSILGGYRSRMRAIVAIIREHPHMDHPDLPSLHLDIVENGFLFDNGKDKPILYHVIGVQVQD